MERTAPLLEAVRRDARGAATAKQKLWTRRAFIAAFICVLMYVHYRTMHALAAFSTEAFNDVSETRGGREADASRARAGATRDGAHSDQAVHSYDAKNDVNGVDDDHDVTTTPDPPGVPDPPRVPDPPPVPMKRAPGLEGDCVDTAGESCADWVASGECDANPAFMLENCKKSCGSCGKHAPAGTGTGTVGDDDGDDAPGGFARLNTGALMPLIGFGTAGLGKDTERAVSWALEAGYRSIDSAQAREWYREDLVGNALAKSGVARDELFLTSKLHPRHLGYETTTTQFEKSLEDLNTEYLDLFLLHYPKCWGSLCAMEPNGTWQDSWRALEDLFRSGKVRAIGVSNFDVTELALLDEFAKVPPAVVQRNSDVFAADLSTRIFCAARGWQYEAYSSLGSQWLMKGYRENPVLTNPAVVSVAEERGVSPASVCLRWALDKGQVAIPRSSNRGRIAENLKALRMPRLTDEEMDELDKLDGHAPFVNF